MLIPGRSIHIFGGIIINMKLMVKLSILLLLSISLNSCNLFFSSPHGRENLDDEAAQITAFTAVPSGEDSIVTMWNWKDPPSWINDERITDIQIQHSIFGYPENYNPILGEIFNDNTTWQHEWKDLIPGITHYFSLFAKSSDGDGADIWFAPIKAKVKLPGDYIQAVTYSVQSYEVDDTGGISSGVLSTTVDDWTVFVLELGFPENVFIESAYIDVGKITTNGPVRVFPVLRDWNKLGPDFHSWEQLWIKDMGDYAVDDNVSLIIDTGGAANPSLIDITDVVRKTAIKDPVEIIIKQENFVSQLVTINNMTDFLVINYYEE